MIRDGPRSLLHPDLPKTRALFPKNWGRGQGEGWPQHAEPSFATGCPFPPNNTSAPETTRPPLTPGPLPASGARGDVFWPSFTLDQTASIRSFITSVRSSILTFQKRVPSPPRIGGEAKVRGGRSTQNHRSQRSALFHPSTPPPSTPETTRPPLTPGPAPRKRGEGGCVFAFVRFKPSHLPSL